MNVGLTVQADSVKRILLALKGQLTFEDNIFCKLLGPIVTPNVANTEFTVNHDLGQVPTNYVWNLDQAFVVYDSRRSLWTNEVMYLKCAGTSANLYLVVF